MNAMQSVSDGMSGLRDIINTAKPHKMKIAVERGVITLSGTVDSRLKRTAIERAAAAIPGVHYIINRIIVKMTATAGGKSVKKERLLNRIVITNLNF